MHIVAGDLWTYNALAYSTIYRGVTTNSTLNSSNDLVMGAGVALQAKDRYPELPTRLGHAIAAAPDVSMHVFHDIHIFSFQTKDDWRKPSRLDLIGLSLMELQRNAEIYNAYAWVLPLPGCGNGGLDWHSQVRPLIVEEYHLPDNVYLILNN